MRVKLIINAFDKPPFLESRFEWFILPPFRQRQDPASYPRVSHNDSFPKKAFFTTVHHL